VAKTTTKDSKNVGKAVADDTKKVAGTVGDDAKEVGGAVAKDTKGAVKTTGSDAKSVGAALKGDVTGDHKNATAKCADGSFWYSAERAGACKDHGGVAEWTKQ
jgi:hypothetical protein